MEKSLNLTSKFLILMNRHCYAAAFQTPTNMYVDIEVMEFCDTVMEKSWKIREFCREDFVATLSGNLTCFLRFRENQGIIFDPV